MRPLLLALTLGIAGEQVFAQEHRPQRYSIEQACSDKAQLHTIAFSGLAFITGDFGASTFLPPGKVCDFFGFQYMRDIDAAQKGHNPMFLNRVAGNVLHILNDAQRKEFENLATEQAPQFEQLATKRWPLIKAFHRALDTGDALTPRRRRPVCRRHFFRRCCAQLPARRGFWESRELVDRRPESVSREDEVWRFQFLAGTR